MAKEQNLSLNSGKMSGCCGRLMCCLQYEYQTYREEGAKTPPVDSTVKTVDGIGVVTESNALAGTIKVKLKDKPDSPPALYKRDDVTVLNRAKKEDANEDEKSENN
jgi:cell fate regulator YaaT (PSP1 superfamily)